MSLLKSRLLNNGELKKTVNAVNEMNISFLPLKLTGTLIFSLTVGTITVNETARKSWNMPNQDEMYSVHFTI